MSEHRCYGCMQLHDGDFCPHCGWPSHKNNEAHQLPVGTVLRGQYVVGRVLGQGGFGITYLGWDRQLDSPVCIKEYFPSHAVSRDCSVSNIVRCHTEQGAAAYRASKERFLREGKVLAQFRDIPEIVSVYGSFEENETVYIVMEYIKGMDLARYISHRGGSLSAEETFRILKPVMEALSAVHRGELVHRDIAPDNIMLHPRGGAKLLDFGAARMVENADVEKGLDRSTEAIVKHGFAPMEQYQTRGNLGPWTDVYAMCATVYYCLTGKIPPEATTRMMGETDFSWANVPGLTDRQRWALEKGMAVLPRDRYTSMAELLEGLFGNAPIQMTHTEPVQMPYQPPQPSVPAPQKKRGKGGLIALICVLAAAVLVLGGFFVASALGDARLGSPQPAPAETEAPATEPPIATEIPIATEAPMAEPPMEAPIAEPEVYESCNVGWILMDHEMLPYFVDGSYDIMHAQGLEFVFDEAHIQITDRPDQALAYARSMLESGCEAIVLQTFDPYAESITEIYALAAVQEVPVILLGADPNLDPKAEDLWSLYPDLVYVGADPNVLALIMVGLFPDLPTDPDQDGNYSISYVFLGDGSLPLEEPGIIQALPDALNQWGYEASPYSEVISDQYAQALRDALERYGTQIEVIFCANDRVAEEAYWICAEYGMDLHNELMLITLGETDRLEELFEANCITAFNNYSYELVAETTFDLLVQLHQGSSFSGPYGLNDFYSRVLE